MKATVQDVIAEIDRAFPNRSGMALDPAHEVGVETILRMLEELDPSEFGGCSAAALSTIAQARRELEGYTRAWRRTSEKERRLLRSPAFPVAPLEVLRGALADGVGKTHRQRDLGGRLLSLTIELEGLTDEALFARYRDRVAKWLEQDLGAEEASKFWDAIRSRNLAGMSAEAEQHLNALREEILGDPSAFAEPPARLAGPPSRAAAEGREAPVATRGGIRQWLRRRSAGELIALVLSAAGVVAAAGQLTGFFRAAWDLAFAFPVKLSYVEQFESNAGYVLHLRIKSTNEKTVYVPVKSLGVRLALDEGVLGGIPEARRKRLAHGEMARVFENREPLDAAIAGRTFANAASSIACGPEPKDLFLLVTVVGPGSTNPSARFALGRVYRSLRVTARRRLIEVEYLDVPLRHIAIIAGDERTHVSEE